MSTSSQQHEPGKAAEIARIEAVCSRPGEFAVTTVHIESFAILLNTELARPGEALTVSVDAQPALTLPRPGDDRLILVKGSDGTWGK
ncbi:MAG TPA: hypothetical protein VMZ31_12415 [Phycisphaerae bacterium]|nr:hypothetical protein [Phycisphaerae bacterium]